MLARPQNNEPLRESFEAFGSTRGYNPAFAQRVHEKRRIEKNRSELMLKIRITKAEHEAKGKNTSLNRIPGWLAEIIRDEAAKGDIPAEAVLLPLRSEKIVEVRDAALYRAKQAKPRISLPQLGKWLGRDHTSCLASLCRHAERNGLRQLTGGKSYLAKAQRARKAYHERHGDKMGFVCASCGSKAIKIIDGRKHPEGFHRRRECTKCGTRFSTMETICE